MTIYQRRTWLETLLAAGGMSTPALEGGLGGTPTASTAVHSLEHLICSPSLIRLPHWGTVALPTFWLGFSWESYQESDYCYRVQITLL